MKKIKIFALWIILSCSVIPSFSTNVDSLWISPNPFDSITIIHFNIVENDTVSLNVYNRWGNPIRTYFQNTFLPSGLYSINFLSDTLPNDNYVVVLKINFTKTLVKNVVKSTLGINENEIVKPKLIFYPNPATSLITVQIQDSDNKESEIIIQNILGKQVLKNKITNSKIVDISALHEGVYFLQLLENNRIIATQKLIKQ